MHIIDMWKNSGRCVEWSDWHSIAGIEEGLTVSVKEFTKSTPVTFIVHRACVKGRCD